MKCNTITTIGQQYLAKCIANNIPIKISNMKIGSGFINTIEEARVLSELVTVKKVIGVQSVEKEFEIVTVNTPLDNIGVNTGFNIREVGIYVLDEGVETLFWYINYDNECSYLQSHDLGLVRVDLKFRLILGSENMVVENVTNTSLFTTKEYVDVEDNKKLDKAGGVVTGDLSIDGKLTVSSDLNVTGMANLTSLNVSNNVGIKNDLNLGDNGEATIRYNPETKSIDFIFNIIGGNNGYSRP